MILRRISVLVVTAAVLLACSAGVAQAGALYDFRVDFDDGTYYATPSGEVTVNDLDVAQTRRIIITPPAAPIVDTGSLPASTNYYSAGAVPGLAPGTTISVRQPASSLSPTEVFTIPEATLSVVTGATALTGTIPAGWFGAVRGDYRCELPALVQTLGAGAFSVPYTTILPGEIAEVSINNSTGDNVNFTKHSPGETPCVDIIAATNQTTTPGGPIDPTPYEVDVSHLLPINAASVRVVLRRGGAILVDVSEDDTNTSAELATRPLPGDIVDVYRPKTAPTPAHSVTVPQVSAVFDPAVDRVAMNTPAAGVIRAFFCRAYACPTQNVRSALNAPAGVNILDYGVSQSTYPAVDLRIDDRITATYEDPNHTLQYSFDSVPGDLAAPVQSIKLASNLKRKTLTKAFKKGYKVKVKSNEPGTASLTLAFPKAKAGKAVTLAKASRSVIAGTTTVKLKFTKAGKKALKKLRTRSSRLATLTSTVTDVSGNVSTLVKRTKIKA